MPPKNKQLTIYPDPTARAICGDNTPGCNRAISCWAITLRQSRPDLSRSEWNFLADTLNGTYIGDEGLGMQSWGPAALCAEIHDAQSLNRTGDRWFGEELTPGSGQAAADALESKVSAMTWAQVQYILTACLFFWDHPDTIDHDVDDWWTVPFWVQAAKE